ncbi:MAG: SGNH/GDSL hydrolase family protein [Clostridiales bacterium]|nr:SGNH/GDSL hydrolase family protein [Clostridiales bacterium]
MDEITILFQGDSITDGNRYKDESSRWDLNHQIGHAYPYVITALLGSASPEKGFRFVNRGVSGDTVTRMEKRWKEDTLAIKPDILSILIGVNDVCGQDWDECRDYPEKFETTYRRLLDAVRAENPAVRFVLIEPFLLKEGALDDVWQERYRRMALIRETVRRIAAEYKAVFVPMQELFDSLTERREAGYWVWDGVHPTEAGHGVIARRWLKETGLWEYAGLSR